MKSHQWKELYHFHVEKLWDAKEHIWRREVWETTFWITTKVKRNTAATFAWKDFIGKPGWRYTRWFTRRKQLFVRCVGNGSATSTDLRFTINSFMLLKVQIVIGAIKHLPTEEIWEYTTRVAAESKAGPCWDWSKRVQRLFCPRWRAQTLTNHKINRTGSHWLRFFFGQYLKYTF